MTSSVPAVPTLVRLASTAAATLVALALAACGSSTGSTHHPATSSSSPPPSTASSGGGSGSSGSGTVPDAATVAAIKNAYAKFFAPNTPENVSLGLLQDGPAFKATIEAQAKGSMAQKSSAKVSKVTLQSANVASVLFTISVNGQPALPNQPGLAIRENGTWKVAGKTFCTLLTLQGTAPSACQTAAATSVPK